MTIAPSLLALLLAQAQPSPEKIQVSTVCELKHDAAHGRTGTAMVSITTPARFDFEYGYFLQAEAGCVDPVDNTGLIKIDFPAERHSGDFSELDKLASNDWLMSSIGKTPYCTCIGKAIFAHGDVIFVLAKAERVWAK